MKDWLRSGLTSERRALSALVLGFFGGIFTLNSFFAPGFRALLLSLGGLYLVAFFAVASGWFWGRWVALGLTVQGALSGVLIALQEGPSEIVIFYTVAHALAWLALVGRPMIALYEGRKDWRERFTIEDGGAERIGRTVMRVTMALPMLIGLVFSPSAAGLGIGSAAAGIALALGGGALLGTLRLRAWAPLAAGVGGALLVGAALDELVRGEVLVGTYSRSLTAASPLLAGLLLLAAFAVFARPIWDALRKG